MFPVSQASAIAVLKPGLSVGGIVRLPEVFFSAVECEVGRNPDTKVDSVRPWKDHLVFLFGRSTVWDEFLMAERIHPVDILQVSWELPDSLELQFWMTLAS